jgi:hypothetical protein
VAKHSHQNNPSTDPWLYVSPWVPSLSLIICVT